MADECGPCMEEGVGVLHVSLLFDIADVLIMLWSVDFTLWNPLNLGRKKIEMFSEMLEYTLVESCELCVHIHVWPF